MQSIIYTMQAKIKYLTQYDTMGYAPVVEAKSSTGFGSPNTWRTHRLFVLLAVFLCPLHGTFWAAVRGASARRFHVSGLPTRIVAFFRLEAEKAECFLLRGGAACTK